MVISVVLETEVPAPGSDDALGPDLSLQLDFKIVVVRRVGTITGHGGHLEKHGSPVTMGDQFIPWL